MGTLFATTNLSFWRIRNPERVREILEGKVTGADAVQPYSVSSMKSFLDVFFSEKTTSCGLSPYNTPRCDFDDDTETVNGLSSYLSNKENLTTEKDTTEMHEDLGYTQWGFSDCKVNEDVYGFWLVCHEPKELDDLGSIKEWLAYSKKSTPYKLLNSEDRKFINEMVESGGVNSDVLGIARKQSLVIVDLKNNLLITEVVGKNQLEDFLGFLMTEMQFQFGPVEMNWNYSNLQYPQILDNIMDKLQADNDCDSLLESLSDIRKNGSIEEFTKQYEEHHAGSMALVDYSGFGGSGVALYAPFSVLFQGSKKPVGVGEALDAFELLRDYKTTKLSGGILEFAYKPRVGGTGEVSEKKRKLHYYIDISRAPIAGIPSLALYKYETDGPTQTQMAEYRKKHNSDVAAYWDCYLDMLYTFITDFYGKFIVEHVLEATSYTPTIEKLVVDVTAVSTDINTPSE